MARYPFIRVPDQPPYVSRAKPDKALQRIADYPDDFLFLLGEAGHGVSRTAKIFVEQIPSSRFRLCEARHPVLLDLFGGNASYHVVEVMALLRNSLVRQLNDKGGVPGLGKYLLPFDALYTIWRGKTDRQGFSPSLELTARAQLGRKLGRITINFATLGAMEWAGDMAEAAQIIGELGWEVEGAIDMGREKLAESFFERTVHNVERFVHKKIAPRLSPRLRRAIGGREVRVSDVPAMMHDLFVGALMEIQRDIAPRSSLMFFIDAIDEAEDETRDTMLVRFVLTGIGVNSRKAFVGWVLAGRKPVDRWKQAAGSKHSEEILGPLPEPDIRHRFRVAGFDDDSVDSLLKAAGAPNPISALALSEAYQRLGWGTA